jgi:hypothetical protein
LSAISDLTAREEKETDASKKIVEVFLEFNVYAEQRKLRNIKNEAKKLLKQIGKDFFILISRSFVSS